MNGMRGVNVAEAAEQFLTVFNQYQNDPNIWPLFGKLADQIIQTNKDALNVFHRVFDSKHSIREIKQRLRPYLDVDHDQGITDPLSYEEQKKHYLLVLKNQPTDVKLWLELAQHASGNNDYQTAKAAFEAVLSLDPSNETIKQSFKDLSLLYKSELGREIYWDIRANDIDMNWGKDDTDYELLSGIISEIRPKRILDIGCGSGRLFPLYYSLQVNEVVGQDIAEAALNIAKQRYNYPNFILLNKTIENFDFPESYFDLSISNRTLQHIPPESIESVIKAICHSSRFVYINEITTKELQSPSSLGFYMFLHDYIQCFKVLNYRIRKEGFLGKKYWYLFEKYQ
jgi:SAM-dependent methyltransferase